MRRFNINTENNLNYKEIEYKNITEYDGTRKKKGVIISAQGEKSFSKEQVDKLRTVMDVEFKTQAGSATRSEFIEMARDAEILAITRRPLKDIDSELIDSLPKLESLAVYTTGCEWIDVDHLNKKGIKLSYLPHYATTPVAEHTLACMLLMGRRIHLSSDKIKNTIPQSISLRGWDLKGKKLGIVGFGRIGQEVAKLSNAFGMNITYYDPIKTPSDIAEYESYSSLLSTSDVIAVTCSKVRNAPPIISYNELSLIKKGCYIINTARADLVDNEAILESLNTKHLSGYTVDDEVAPLADEHLADYGRVYQTGHTAWYSTEAIERGTEEWTNNIVALAKGINRNLFNERVLINE
ncbi:D-isomer specific 2-hydroxyacid dehydrogenase family protein [Oceanirhabdus seepicola]|uniref:Uncharacterized protein n=1 Tax=Oceanirhabdus seepicola TaxID=2828781 RepID=A0A9J6NZG1_9CLOT|nr:hypothetical protein [Oceanirhabdus seepicola]